MVPAKTVGTCRWAQPTIFLPWPLWCDAAQDEWSCTIARSPRLLDDPAECRTCARYAQDAGANREPTRIA